MDVRPVSICTTKPFGPGDILVYRYCSTAVQVYLLIFIETPVRLALDVMCCFKLGDFFKHKKHLSGFASLGQSLGDSPEWFLLRGLTQMMIKMIRIMMANNTG